MTPAGETTGPVRATVVIPTFDNGEPIRLALASALAQTERAIEVFVIGDGCLDLTREIVAEVQAGDPRVRFFDNEKGARHGELHRHAALAEARGEIVCYLCDDDLWLPNHVEEMLRLLAAADFAHAGTLLVGGDGGVETWLVDLEDPDDREMARSVRCPTNLSASGHRLEAYRRLPHGWRTTPGTHNTDHWMTRQWLEQSWVRAVSGHLITNIHPANSFWLAEGPEAKLAATEQYARHLLDPGWMRDEWPALVITAQRNSWAWTRARERRFETAYDRMRRTRWWRARAWAAALIKRVRRARPDRARAGR